MFPIPALFGACAEAVIIFISSQYVSVSVPILVGMLWIIQKFYLRTSKQLRLMDIEAKAPLSAFVLETIQGIVSIRAFDRTGEFSSRNTTHLDYSQRAMYMLLSVQVWLKMILDFVVAILAVLVTSLAVNFRSSQSLGFLGLALVNLVRCLHNMLLLILLSNTVLDLTQLKLQVSHHILGTAGDLDWSRRQN